MENDAFTEIISFYCIQTINFNFFTKSNLPKTFTPFIFTVYSVHIHYFRLSTIILNLILMFIHVIMYAIPINLAMQMCCIHKFVLRNGAQREQVARAVPGCTPHENSSNENMTAEISTHKYSVCNKCNLHRCCEYTL